MAKLFKNKLIKEKLETFEVPNLEDKIQVLAKWTKALTDNSLHSKTESQCEQAFNQDVFVTILGYSMFPSTPYTIEPKASTEMSAQKPDAALGFFEGEKARVQVVCEIKDSKTSLDKSQKREGNLSPVQQAFKYKPQYKDCRFVIATNFSEIRLYRDNQLDFESFNLLNLVSDKDHYFEFRKFYFLLCAENMLSKRGESKTEKLLSEIRIEQEHITKDFYKEYKALRYQLIDNIIKNNPEQSVSLVIEKAQKLIDRIVFVCFCEDIDLLPENKLVEVIEYAKKGVLDQPVWDVMQLFFVAIDKGSKKLGIPDGYNGELFKPDVELDALLIDDDICEQFVRLGRYDFSEDLSVNILGHIFEQSISDLENLRAEYEGQAIQKKDSKRKKDGIYYTPDYIVDYIVNQAVGGYLQDQESVILEKNGLKEGITQENYDKRHIKAYEEYQTVLRNIKVLDPACGSGAFLVKVFDYLLAENARVSEILTQSRGGMTTFMDTESYTKDILQNNIYGVDINAESVEITKLSLWLKTAQKGKKLATLKDNIKCGNSLIDDPEVAGDKAFKWEDEFKDIMEAGGFDVVVGNPPYLRIQGLKDAHHKESLFYEKNYQSATGKYDIYVLFMEKGNQLLGDNGKLGFILPHKFLVSDFGRGIRSYLSMNKSIEKILHFGSHLVFEDVSTYTAVIFLSKKNIALKYITCNPLEILQNIDFNQYALESLSDKPWSFSNKREEIVLKKINAFKKTVKQFLGQVFQGVVTTGDDIFHLRGKIEGNKFHGYSNRLNKEVTLESSLIRCLIKGEDVKRYSSPKSDLFVIYPHVISNSKTVPFEEDIFKEQFPLGYSYLKQFKDELIQKKIKYKTNPKYWYSLHRSRELKIFETDKLVMPYLCNKPQFTLDTNKLLFNTKVYGVPLKNDQSSIAFLSLLNSKLFWFWLKNTASEYRGGYFSLTSNYVEPFPLPETNAKEKKYLAEKSLTQIKSGDLFDKKMASFKTYLQSTYNLKNIPKSFDDFYELEFSGIQRALKKLKVTLSKKDEFELMELFEDQKNQALELKAKIDQTDREIDQMVYELYGLTEEEIKIVEEATQ